MSREASRELESGQRAPLLPVERSPHQPLPMDRPKLRPRITPGSGLLLVNADDWGRNTVTTERTFDCIRSGGVSAVSAMVFMEGSEHAAAVAREHEIEVGLHLNLTTPFSAPSPAALSKYQQKISRYLRRHRFSQVMFHPGLIRAFQYVVFAQLEEFHRLYGEAPCRIDGHHHMHLSANVLLQRLIPPHTIVRRNFSFDAGEKSIVNRYYRHAVDRMLARHHRLTDYFFSLAPLGREERLRRIIALSRQHVVEVEVHPINEVEYQFLTGGGLGRLAGDVKIGVPSDMYLHSPVVDASHMD